MRIVEVSFSLSSGGAERFVVDLSNELAKNHNVRLITLRDDTVAPWGFYKDEVSKAVDYECLKLGKGLTPSMWWKIGRAISDFSPEVVHFHGRGMPFWMIVPMMFSRRYVSFVQTIHNDVHNGYDTLIYKVMANVWGRRGKLKFVALSETNYKDLVKQYPYCKSRCIVNGRAPMLPTTKLEAVKKELDAYKPSSNTRIFLHVARCNEVKNQQRLIRTFNRMASEGLNAQLVIIGAGFDSPLGDTLRQMAGPAIHFLGTRKNISDYQQCADVFCLSSDYEGMPITILEALLCGTPVVSTPVCGAVDAIRNGENGFLSADFTDDAYYDALKRAYNNLEAITATAQKEKDTTPYTMKQCADSYAEFFRERLAK